MISAVGIACHGDPAHLAPMKEVRPMFRQVWTVALAALTALGSLTATTAQESKETGGETKSPPAELTVDFGGGVRLDLVLIPAGEFLMGSPDSDTGVLSFEKPQHRVRITKPFYLGKHAVTQEQWEAVMGSNPSYFKGPQNPVENVSWDDCQVFLGRLNGKLNTGRGKFQLPTEAQWEYACRAGSTTRYCFGDDESGLDEYAWYARNSDGKTHPVGEKKPNASGLAAEKKPNAWGLYDMHGNVWEWCQDRYDGGCYANSPANDPTGAATGSFRARRGGSWNLPASQCRSANRDLHEPGHRDSSLGFRVSVGPADK
jgi:formylglycine-generating enzyme required for sulfatase activity